MQRNKYVGVTTAPWNPHTITITIAHHYRVNTTRLTHAESYGVRRTVEGAFNLDSGNRDGKRGPVVVKRTDQYGTALPRRTTCVSCDAVSS